MNKEIPMRNVTVVCFGLFLLVGCTEQKEQQREAENIPMKQTIMIDAIMDSLDYGTIQFLIDEILVADCLCCDYGDEWVKKFKPSAHERKRLETLADSIIQKKYDDICFIAYIVLVSYKVIKAPETGELGVHHIVFAPFNTLYATAEFSCYFRN